MFFKTDSDIITATQWQRWYTVYDVRDNDSCLKLQQMFITIQKSVTPFFKHLQIFSIFAVLVITVYCTMHVFATLHLSSCQLV